MTIAKIVIILIRFGTIANFNLAIFNRLNFGNFGNENLSLGFLDTSA